MSFTKEQIDFIHEPCTKVIEAQQELLKMKEDQISGLKDIIQLLEKQIAMLKILANYKEPLN